MSADLRQIIQGEFTKCAKDPIYFMRKYCHIQHPQRGRILFNLYPFQEKVLSLFHQHEYLIVLKSRQLGISTLVAGYALWLMIFHKDKNVLALATTRDTARNLVTKVIFMYDQLPKWMKLPTVEKNKLSLRLNNGSRIIAKSSNTDAARSEAVSLLIMDECAFIENASIVFTAAQQTLATGGQCIILSTPDGVGNFFHQTWVKAENKENSFIPIKLPWHVHPERNQSWRDQQDADLGPRMASQECDAEFLTSGHGVFEPEIIQFYEQTHLKNPIERRGVDGNLWIWELPNYSKSYVTVVDVARGDGKDYSSFHIFDVEDCTQVAEYRGKLSPKELGNVVIGVSSEYNDALLVVENSNIGWATIEQILEREYRNLYYSSKASLDTVESYLSEYEKDQLVPGFTMSTRTRPLVIAKLIEYVNDRTLIINSKRLLNEMKVFIWKNGKPQAQIGYNDDLVLPAGVFTYLRDTALRIRQQSQELTRSQLSSFVNVNRKTPVIMTSNYVSNNPYNMQIHGQNVDFSWLLK